MPVQAHLVRSRMQIIMSLVGTVAFSRFFCIASIVAMLLLPPQLFAGSVTYSYTGNPFTTVVGNVQSGDFLSISMTLTAPLLASQADEVVTPISWSFSDGVTADTLTNANHTYIFQGFEFATNASGDISGWAVGANTGTASAFSWTANNWSIFGGITTLDEYYESFDVSYNQLDPGTWAVAAASTTPEPSTALLLCFPLAWLMRRCYKNARAAQG
jgi:hypothetical protein